MLTRTLLIAGVLVVAAGTATLGGCRSGLPEGMVAMDIVTGNSDARVFVIPQAEMERAGVSPAQNPERFRSFEQPRGERVRVSRGLRDGERYSVVVVHQSAGTQQALPVTAVRGTQRQQVDMRTVTPVAAGK